MKRSHLALGKILSLSVIAILSGLSSFLGTMLSLPKLMGDMEGVDAGVYQVSDYLLLGGSGHRTGKNKEGGNYEALRKQAELWYPGTAELAHWSAQDCVTLDKVPYIGHLSAAVPNWYVATGFGKWGMTGSMVSAMLLRDMILGRENAWSELFTPQRMNWRASMPQLCGNISSSVSNLVKRLFPFSLNGKEKPPGCRHMGCQLAWNPEEESWDCPCHGSRYGVKGELICGPSQKSLEKKK